MTDLGKYMHEDSRAAWNAFPAVVVQPIPVGVFQNPAIERAILESLPPGTCGTEMAIASRVLFRVAAASKDVIFKSIWLAKMDGLLEYGTGFGNLTITTKGLERLEELIHRDITRTAHAAANDILAGMGLPA